jgi:hypothetical protein
VNVHIRVHVTDRAPPQGARKEYSCGSQKPANTSPRYTDRGYTRGKPAGAPAPPGRPRRPGPPGRPAHRGGRAGGRRGGQAGSGLLFFVLIEYILDYCHFDSILPFKLQSNYSLNCDCIEILQYTFPYISLHIIKNHIPFPCTRNYFPCRFSELVFILGSIQKPKRKIVSCAREKDHYPPLFRLTFFIIGT